MFTLRVYADQVVRDAILTAAYIFHKTLAAKLQQWDERINDKALRLIPTERRVEQEMEVTESEAA